MRTSTQAILTAVLALVLGCGNADDGSDQVDVDGVQRVTLTGNYVTSSTGQGWDLEGGRIALDEAEADFVLSMTMVILLFPSQAQVGFCEQRPPDGAQGFERVEDVPSDVSGCTDWFSADLGGNSPSISESIAGRGFVVRDRSAVPVAKVMTVSGSIVDASVQVTFDITRL